ncbi:MAG: TIGR00375 family protein [Firmicutes bacterium]|nr:TIGR00375 family protein [Bacillota bacterium]
MTIFADLHIHIGSTSSGQAVKITASRQLTLPAILEECRERKGINIAGIIDGASPAVLKDIKDLIEQGELAPLDGGGLIYKDDLTLILGAEIELAGPTGGSAHFLAFTPTLSAMEELSAFLETGITNIMLSSQKARLPMWKVHDFITKELDGLFLPAHAFTPFKGVYGSCVASLAELGVEFPAIELGLSSDSELADRIPELRTMRFLSNSDAHSLPKIAREYNALQLQKPDFNHLKQAVLGHTHDVIIANYGLDPRLGKYYRSFCPVCDDVVNGVPPITVCLNCGTDDVVVGVRDRIEIIAENSQVVHPAHRAPYIYQIPLEFVPGIGPKTLGRLLDAFGTEMQVLHETSKEELEEVVGSVLADRIIKARTGSLALDAGGGGRYGRVQKGEK